MAVRRMTRIDKRMSFESPFRTDESWPASDARFRPRTSPFFVLFLPRVVFWPQAQGYWTNEDYQRDYRNVSWPVTSEIAMYRSRATVALTHIFLYFYLSSGNTARGVRINPILVSKYTVTIQYFCAFTVPLFQKKKKFFCSSPWTDRGEGLRELICNSIAWRPQCGR